MRRETWPLSQDLQKTSNLFHYDLCNWYGLFLTLPVAVRIRKKVCLEKIAIKKRLLKKVGPARDGLPVMSSGGGSHLYVLEAPCILSICVRVPPLSLSELENVHARALLRLVVMVVAIVVHVTDVAGVRIGRRRRAVQLLLRVMLLVVLLVVLVMVVRMSTMVDGVVLWDRRDHSTLSKLLPYHGGRCLPRNRFSARREDRAA